MKFVKKSNSEKRYQREQKKAIERMLRDAKIDSEFIAKNHNLLYNNEK